MQFCEINFFNWSKSDRRKLMVVSLTQAGRKLKGANFDGSKVVSSVIESFLMLLSIFSHFFPFGNKKKLMFLSL